MDPDRPEYCEFVGFEDGGTMYAHLENYRRRCFDDNSFQRGLSFSVLFLVAAKPTNLVEVQITLKSSNKVKKEGK